MGGVKEGGGEVGGGGRGKELSCDLGKKRMWGREKKLS